MKKIDRPSTCFTAKVVEVANDRQYTATFPALIEFAASAAQLADTYDMHRGNPLTIPNRVNSVREQECLKYLFKHPGQALSYIGDLRTKAGGESCPMCGGENPFSLDHYLPISNYPEHGLLSYNLVPACSCNSIRRDIVVDRAVPARILHPYYDDILLIPLFHVEFDPQELAPVFSIVIDVPTDDPSFPNISFHIEQVLKRTTFFTFFHKRWEMVREYPDEILAENHHSRGSTDEFRAYLRRLAKQSGKKAPNSWNAVFYRSIARSPVADWVYANTLVVGLDEVQLQA